MSLWSYVVLFVNVCVVFCVVCFVLRVVFCVVDSVGMHCQC